MGKVVVYTINGEVWIKDYNRTIKKEKEIKIIILVIIGNKGEEYCNTPEFFWPLIRNQNRKGREKIRVLY